MFKKVFSDEKNKHILKDFLEAILNISIQKLEIKNPEMTKNILSEKASILDVRASLNDNVLVDIEMQVKSGKEIITKSMVYVNKLSAISLDKGQEYKEIKKTIGITILMENMFKRNNYHQIAHMKFEKGKDASYVDMGYEKEEETLTEITEMHYIEIPKFVKKHPEEGSKLEQWLWLIYGKEEEKIEMASDRNERIQEVVDILNTLSLDSKEREEYEDILRARINYAYDMSAAEQKGIEQGIEQGKKETAQKMLETAKKMLEKKIPIETIMEITGFSEDQINSLK